MKLPNFKNVIAKLQDVRFHILGLIFVAIVISIVAVGERVSILNARKIAFSSYERETSNLLSVLDNNFEEDSTFVKVLSSDPEVVDMLNGSVDFDVNVYLEGVNTFREAATLYVLDIAGNCIASTDPSFLGNNYSYRPYFTPTIEHGSAFSVATGVTSNVLGFYFASSIVSRGQIIGVIVEKVEPNEILGDQLKNVYGIFYVMTPEGVVFYSTQDDDLFFWQEPDQKSIAQIEQSKQFDLNLISSPKYSFGLSTYVEGSNSYLSNDGTEYVYYDEVFGETDHSLRVVRLSDYKTVMESVNPVLQQTYILSTVTTVTVIVFLVILFYFIRFYRSQFTLREELSKAEKSLSSLVEKLPVGIIRTTVDGSFNFLNPRALKIFGFKSLVEAKKHPVSSFYVNLDDRKGFISLLKSGKLVEDKIVEIKDINENKKTIKASYWISTDKQNIEMIFEDVTDSIKTSERFRSVALSVSDCIWELDKDGQFTFCSENVYQLLGYKSNDLLGKTFCGFMQEKECVRFKREFGEAVSKKKPIKGLSYEFKTKTGSSIFLEINGVPIFDSARKLIGYRGASKDLTQILEQRESLELLTSAVEQSATTIVITDLDGNIEYVNSHFEDLTGYKREDVLGKNPKILNSGYHDKSFYQNLWNTILSGKTFRGKFRNKKKDGSLFWEDSTITPIRNSSGEITHFMAIKEDITNQMALEEERTLYQQITKNIGDELYLIDDNEGFAFVNEAVLLSSGYDAGTFMKLNLKDLEVDYVKGVWSKRLENLKNAGNSENLEVTFYSKNRDRQIKELTIRSLNYKGRPHLLATGRDVTKRREEEEIQKEKTYEIQKLNELTTGREYKIIELQNKLEKLEKLVGKYKKYFDK